ncbi:chemotaxis protein [Mycobacterium xenopi]|uniref:chemotaxis protein n=1 Tax=Mycobacterium xenopi TaxID=1789 RepID=UPI000A147D27|nr:chemotaxis protein [Mycobacterium xenopi]ORX19443.1 chemotaxis protein [Mycobacterium xenopi]SPX94807.1 Uncharacterised protein [Mycobacterium xenopi]
MTGQASERELTAWADSVLAGTGWSAATVREAADRVRDDLASAALADGFAAAARALAVDADSAGGAR